MRIGIFCSGGDAPGMNACVRAVVRAAVAGGHEAVGILDGYQGLLQDQFEPLTARSVSGITQRGGTILHTSRSTEFRKAEGVKKAADVLRRHQIDALVPIGGDGTFRGAIELAKVWDGQIIGCPGTIDNDLQGTDFTIGFHTAVTTAVDAVDKIRDTAESHERLFLIEVMGRHSGYIAVHTALAAAAEIACIPETQGDVAQINRLLCEMRAKGKRSILVIVAEGDELGGAEALKNALTAAGCPLSMRVVILGHLQRGGSPVVADRVLASRLGVYAVEAITRGETGKMAGEIGGKLALTPLADTLDHHPVPDDLLKLLETLAG